jgi:hypothetical protein
MRKATVRKRMIHMEPGVVRRFMAEPLIVIDMRQVVHMAGGQVLCLALLDRIASRRRSLWNMSLIRARSSLCRPAGRLRRPPAPLRRLTTPLRHSGRDEQKSR